MQYLLGDDEHLRALVNSRGWKLITANYQRIREYLANNLVSSDCGEVETALLRGKIRAFDLAIRAPELVMEEIKEVVPTED